MATKTPPEGGVSHPLTTIQYQNNPDTLPLSSMSIFSALGTFGKPGMEGEDFIFCLLGEGAVPWPETFQALSDIDYKGALSVEFEAYRYYEQVLGSDPAAAAKLSYLLVMALIGAGL